MNIHKFEKGEIWAERGQSDEISLEAREPVTKKETNK